jgi:flagellar FliL protein
MLLVVGISRELKVDSGRVKNSWIVLGGFLGILWLLLGASLSWAQDEGGEGAESGEAAVLKRAIYIPIKPPFVVNYGGKGRLRYMKASVSLRVSDTAGANSVRHHMPYIRNNLILLFSSQTEDRLDNQEGKELLRQEALAEIAAILEQEDGENKVEDLYFNQLVIQK